MRVLCVISVLTMFSLQYAGGKGLKNFEVFWVPPQVETYTPVTAENIEKMAFKIVTIKNERQADEIVGLIHKSDQAANSTRIRVKISTDEQFYNFDSNGVGVSSAGEAVGIDLKKLKMALCE